MIRRRLFAVGAKTGYINKEVLRMIRRRLFAIGTVMLLLGLAAVASEDPGALSGEFSSPSEILEYRSLPEYHEAPALAQLVAEGKLPPVEERLPETPLVWKRSVMPDGIGVYGDRAMWTVGSTPTGWNPAAGQRQGWGGVGSALFERLVSTSWMWMLEAPDPVPRLAKSWEWSDDGMTLTMYLVEGVKWSDGVEFTADDVLFRYYDNVLDEHVPSGWSAGSWTFGGKVTELEKIDDYTIRWHFGEPFPVRTLFQMGDPVNSLLIPAHIYKQFHPRYNPKMTYQDYILATPPQTLPAVVLGPFVPVAYKPGQQMVLVRNPYYWQVDEQGNQLPYWDEIVVKLAENWMQWRLDTLAGVADKGNFQPAQHSMLFSRAKEADAPFVAQFGKYDDVYHLTLNLSLYTAVDDDRDRALRELFRDIRFREAVSHLVDREGIAASVFWKLSSCPLYLGWPSGSELYPSEENIVTYPYNPARAKELLAELGFVDTDGDGILNWPEGSLIAGDELIIEVLALNEVVDSGIAEALVAPFREAGIDLRVKLLEGGLLSARMNVGDFEMLAGRNDGATTPWANPGSIGPVSLGAPGWHMAGPGGERELLPFEEEIQKLLLSTGSMSSAAERKATFERIARLYSENIYTVGVVQNRMAIGFAKRFRNLPSDFPIRGYGREDSAVPMGIRWTPKELQLGSLFQNLIPAPATYKAQPWYPEGE